MSGLATSPLIQQLIEEEGLRLFPYTDTVGKLTIGIGRNLTDVGISTNEAYMLLQNDIAKCQNQMDIEIPWWRGLDTVRQSAVTNLCFNMGIQNLLGFNNMLHDLASGNYDAAANDLLASRWAKQVQQSRRDRIIGQIRSGA